MPLVNYCRKCRTETPLGESCPYCGGRLPKTGEQLSFGIILIPSPGVTVGAAAISVALGIIFGMYPAVKASGLQPVVALRAD